MIRSMYTAATGMQAQQLYMDVISNNLANVNTNGFKRSALEFQDLMYQHLREPGVRNPEGEMAPSGLDVGLGVRPAATDRMFDQGSANNTTNPYDLAIDGEGFFQIQMPDGSTAYSRDGQFQRSSDGTVVTSDGNKLYPEIVVPQDAVDFTVGKDGKVSATVPGQNGSEQTVELGQLELARFINPSGLKVLGGNLYSETDASGEPILNTPQENNAGTVLQGYVEASNVQVVQEMVNMITAQRAYEIVSKSIQVSDDMLQTTNAMGHF